MASASPPEGGPGGAGASLALACLDMADLAGRLAQQHAEELKAVLRLPGDQANQARTKLETLAQALHYILSTSTSSSDGEERGSYGAIAMEEGGEERMMEEVSCSHGGHGTSMNIRSLVPPHTSSLEPSKG
jgi:hypothetical protein